MCVVNVMCLCLIAVVGAGGVLNRLILRRGMGLRFCQFLAIGMGLPAVVMLAMNDKLDRQAVGTLMGAVIGFFAGRGGNDEP